MPDDFEAKAMMTTLELLDKKVGKAFARKALRADAKFQLGGEKASAPQVSGVTADALKVRAGKRQSTRVTMLTTITQNDFPAHWYAQFVELGRKKMPGKHWMRQAFIGGMSAAKQIIRETLSKLINEYKGKDVDGDS